MEARPRPIVDNPKDRKGETKRKPIVAKTEAKRMETKPTMLHDMIHKMLHNMLHDMFFVSQTLIKIDF